MYNVYNKHIDIIEADDNVIHFYVSDLKETFRLVLARISSQTPLTVFSWDVKDQVLLSSEGSSGERFVLYVKDGTVCVVKEEKGKTFLTDVFPMTITNELEGIEIRQNSLSSVEVVNQQGQQLVQVMDFLHDMEEEGLYPCDIPVEKDEKRFFQVGKVEMGRYVLIVKYDDYMERIQVHKILFDRIVDSEALEVSFLNEHKLAFTNSATGTEKLVCFQRISPKNPTRLFKTEESQRFQRKHLVALYEINHIKHYVYMRSTGLYIIKNNPKKALRFAARLHATSFGRNIYLYGRMAHNGYRTFGQYDTLYAMDEKHGMATFKRPFKNIKFFKQFGYFKVPADTLDFGENVHYSLLVGSKERPLHPFPLASASGKNKPSSVHALKKIDEKVLALRTNVHGQATYSIVPDSPMYGFGNRLKMKAAHLISSVFYRRKKRNVNLFFEKQASKADESGFRVFEKVMETKGLKSDNYFILDKTSSAYPEMKQKHGDFIIDRFSFKHYLLMFNADYFVSSDLSNHVINDRIYINEIVDKIQKVPLIFLQHGIMFAKPVENPQAKIFYKEFSSYNIHKNIVNSKLEAGEFYKMGYTDDDLIYTGLATFDYAKLNEGTDKIVYMPTYRSWEEGMIYSGDIQKTTYFQSLMKVIQAFEKAGLRDKLVIVSHNKFVEYIYNSMGEYKDMVAENPSEALKVGRVFISDFSSAIYDAIYRGAYPIFYWEDKSYLIEKYQATPPVNEENAPGPIAMNAEQVVELAKKAIQRNYELEEEYKAKYKQINAFDDNKNTDRVVEYMKEDGIL